MSVKTEQGLDLRCSGRSPRQLRNSSRAGRLQQDDRRSETATTASNCYVIFDRMLSISSLLNARMVSVLTFPNEPTFAAKAVMVSSSGASNKATPSYAPIVQNSSTIFMPIFSASAMAASPRLMVSLMLRMPWSANRIRLIYLASVIPPFLSFPERLLRVCVCAKVASWYCLWTAEVIKKYGGFDKWGGPDMDPHYAAAWAWAGNTPFKWGKQIASHLGGIRNPMVIAWPNRESFFTPDNTLETVPELDTIIVPGGSG
jgi:hypothetical protein